MGKAYMGKILNVDLSSGKCTEEELGEEMYKKYLGGYGLGAKIIYDRLPRGADPLGEESILGLAPGLLTGTGALFSGRYMAMGKSPLTGGWGDANSGGTMAPEIKKAGYDAIFIKGIASDPVYIQITDGKVEVREAKNLWGKTTVETEDLIAQDLGIKGIKTLSIGQSGEKISLISGIVNDKGRIAARSGLGAVMGSKKLKAIAVKGNTKVQVHDREQVNKLNKDFLKFLNKSIEASLFDRLKLGGVARFMGKMLGHSSFHTKLMPPLIKSLLDQYGTCGFTSFYCETGESPSKNWKGLAGIDFPLEKSRLISDDEVIKYQVKKFSCSTCPIGCGGIFKVEDGPYPLEETHKPEYETITSFGALCLNNDLKVIMQANHLCNLAGIDTISTGSVIAFAIECFEQGILTEKDTDGIKMQWGDGEAILALLEKIIKREGIGDVLADGVKRAAEHIGRGAEQYAIHAGGQELSYHDPRIDPGFGTAYQVEPTPGRHTIASRAYQELLSLEKRFPELNKIPFIITDKKMHTYAGKAAQQAANSKFVQVTNSLGYCIFGVLSGGSAMPFAEMINAATGWDFGDGEYMNTGERIQSLRQAFNVREGIKPADFKVHPRATGNPPLSDGPLKGVTLDMDILTREYFDQFQWDAETGRPSKNRLEELGLQEVAKELY